MKKFLSFIIFGAIMGFFAGGEEGAIMGGIAGIGLWLLMKIAGFLNKHKETIADQLMDDD